MPKPEKCYLCYGSENMTDDHIPPKGFFPEPRPADLITVRCCLACNMSYQLDDEAFRVWAASLMGRSPAGDWIWQQKVVGSSFARSPKLKANVVKHLSKLPVQTPGGVIQMYGISIPIPRANRFLIRLAKGMLAKFSPEKDYSSQKFEVTQLDLKQDNITYLSKMAMYDHRGDRVFRFWRAVAPEVVQAVGLFAFCFYDASLFMVSVDMAG